MNKIDKYVQLLLYFAAAVLFLAKVYAHWTYLEDDPLIVFRYALNFHAGHGWVMNPGEHVNGCTSCFGLLLVTALSGFLSIDSAIVALKVFGILCGLVVLWKSQEIARIMLPDAPLLAAIAPSLLAYRSDFCLAMTNGMETPYACLFLICAIVVYYRGLADQRPLLMWSAVALFVLAGLSRPDLTIIYPGLAALRLLRKERIYPAYLLAYAVPFVCLGAFYILYYHSIVPNTYYAKLVGIATGVSEGGDYIAQYLFFPAPIVGGVLSLLCLLAVASRPGAFTEIYFVCIGLGLFYLLRTSGDWMVDGRFAMPILPLVVASWLVGVHVLSDTLLASRLKITGHTKVIAAAAGILLVAAGYFDNVTREAYIHKCSRIRSYSNAVRTDAQLSFWMSGAPDGRRQISDWLNQHARPGDNVAMPEMGLIPCLNMDLNFIDVEGLTDAAIARMPYPHWKYGVYAGPYWDDMKSPMGKYIESRKPEYVVSAFSDGKDIGNPNYVKVSAIVAYVDNTGKCRFIIYKRKSQE
jgi:hypothetical protein